MLFPETITSRAHSRSEIGSVMRRFIAWNTSRGTTSRHEMALGWPSQSQGADSSGLSCRLCVGAESIYKPKFGQNSVASQPPTMFPDYLEPNPETGCFVQLPLPFVRKREVEMFALPKKYQTWSISLCAKATTDGKRCQMHVKSQTPGSKGTPVPLCRYLGYRTPSWSTPTKASKTQPQLANPGGPISAA